MKHHAVKLTRRQLRRLAQATDYLAAALDGDYKRVSELSEDELRLNLLNTIDAMNKMDAALHDGAETIVSWRAKPL